VEIPAPAQRSHRRLDAVTQATDDLDTDGALGAFWVRGRDPAGGELLVQRLDHLVLLLEVDP
jgi:hypothetical protein